MENISKSWNDLLLQSMSNNIFLTWEWQFSWAECFLNKNKKLFVLAVYKNDELVGITPWYIHRVRYCGIFIKQIEFLGTPETASDYLNVIIKKGKEKEVTSAIYHFLFSDVSSSWDSFMLRDIPSESLFLLHFIDKIEEDGKYSEIKRGSFCPIIKLPETYNKFLSELSPNRRQQFKRHLRVSKRDNNVKYHSFLTNDIMADIDRFFLLFEEKKDYSDKKLKRFIKRFASNCKEKNCVQIDFLISYDKDIAGLLHLWYQDTLSMYLMVIDKTFNPKISIGNVLVGISIERSINQGDSFYDFLKGVEQYKFHWADYGEQSLDFIFYQRKVIPILFAIRRYLKYIAKIILR